MANNSACFQHFYAPVLKDWVHIVLLVIYGMKAHLINTHLLLPKSRSSAKVKVRYQGHFSQKMTVLGALVFQKHILFPRVTEFQKFSLVILNRVKRPMLIYTFYLHLIKK